MKTLTRVQSLGSRSIGIALAGLLVAGLAALSGPMLASAQTGGRMNMSGDSPKMARVGNTQGWLHGKTVKFHYTRNFFCKEPPHAATKSHCEVGANYNAIPAGEFDPLYVVVPVGFTPKRSTLQCPKAGMCVDHPHRIDLSRVFGSSTKHSLLPPHSHVVTTAAAGEREWWNVDVVGVTSRKAWHRIVVQKNYQVIHKMRNNGNKHVTENIPTNLFLFFSVLK